MGKNKWWRRRSSGGKAGWDQKVAKPQHDQRPPEGEVTEYVSVVLKKNGDADDADRNSRMLVVGTMTFAEFTARARVTLNITAHRPFDLRVGPRTVRPDPESTMSSFPKQDVLYVTYTT